MICYQAVIDSPYSTKLTKEAEKKLEDVFNRSEALSQTLDEWHDFQVNIAEYRKLNIIKNDLYNKIENTATEHFKQFLAGCECFLALDISFLRCPYSTSISRFTL